MAEIDFTIPTGVTWRRVVVRKDSAGNRVSVAGMHAKLEVRQRPGGQVYLSISTDEGTIKLEADAVDGDPTGVVTMIVPGPRSAPVSATTGVYDMRLWSDTEDGEPSFRPIEGKITFDLQVTQVSS
ncbi:MAG: hypothetical protein HGA45_27365 [Chloroflexales bacterium]|nr:hypothetical protein [Chloroflexales bacterium]